MSEASKAKQSALDAMNRDRRIKRALWLLVLGNAASSQTSSKPTSDRMTVGE